MTGNIIGERFVLTSFGESHGKVVGAVIDGLPGWAQALRGGHPAGPGPAEARPVDSHDPEEEKGTLSR